MMNYQILCTNIDYDCDGLPIDCLITPERKDFKAKVKELILKDGTEGSAINLFLSSIFLGINLSTILIDAEPKNQLFIQENKSYTDKLKFPFKSSRLSTLLERKLFILLKPGHYDIIYESSEAITELIIILDNQRYKFEYLYNMINENLNGGNPEFNNPFNSPQEENKTFTKDNHMDITPTPDLLQVDSSVTPDIYTNKNQEGKNKNNTQSNKKEKEIFLNESLSEEMIIICKNISKKKNEVIKNLQEMIQRKSNNPNKKIHVYEINFQCPFCAEYHENKYWKETLGEKDYNLLIEEIKKRNNEVDPIKDQKGGDAAENGSEKNSESEFVVMKHECTNKKCKKLNILIIYVLLLLLGLIIRKKNSEFQKW